MRLLEHSLRRSRWRLVSYALMSSHIHLAFLSGSDDLGKWAQSLHVRFAHWINRRLRAENPKTLGHVFADRPWSRPSCLSRARFLIAYHHRNPLEAGVVERVEASTWTSQRAYLGLAPKTGGLDVSLGLELSGYDDSASGRLAFHVFVERTDVTLDDVDAPGALLEVHRSCASGDVLAPADIVQRAAVLARVRLSEVLGGSRVAAVVFARRVALVAGIQSGHSAAELASALGITASGASRLIHRPHDDDAVRLAARRLLAAIEALG